MKRYYIDINSSSLDDANLISELNQIENLSLTFNKDQANLIIFATKHIGKINNSGIKEALQNNKKVLVLLVTTESDAATYADETDTDPNMPSAISDLLYQMKYKLNILSANGLRIGIFIESKNSMFKLNTNNIYMLNKIQLLLNIPIPIET